MKPLNVSRENFPASKAFVDGMTVIKPECDNYEIACHYDVKYYNNGRKDLFLQILQPINPPGKTSLIIFISGSAFHKQNVHGRVPQLALLAAKGFCVALLEYTPSEEAPFPALVCDAKEGIKYMKAHNEQFNIDVNAVFMMGDSSGAYTALMAGLTNGIGLFEKDSDTDYSVRGIIDFYGPTDITTMNCEPSTQNHSEPNSPEGFLIGQKEVLKNLEFAKPTIIKNYISKEKEYPDVLMFHGSNDELVPFSQSCELYTVLKENGINTMLYQIDGAHHGDRQFWSTTVLDIIEKFIRQLSKKD